MAMRWRRPTRRRRRQRTARANDRTAAGCVVFSGYISLLTYNPGFWDAAVQKLGTAHLSFTGRERHANDKITVARALLQPFRRETDAVAGRDDVEDNILKSC